MYLANLCNSTAIEIYSDIIRVSHGFDGCQILEYIADSARHALSAENDHITNFAGPLIYTSLLELHAILKVFIYCRYIKYR
jgi:hypothetical protein